MSKGRLEQFFNSLRLNVVRVKAQSILTTATSNATTPVFGPAATRNATMFRLEGDGVIIDGGFVLCLAETVVIPPFMLASVNRYPLPVASRTPTSIMNQLVPMGTITLSIETKTSCANNSGLLTADYPASIFVVDPANNLVLLAIDVSGTQPLLSATGEPLPEIGPRNPVINFAQVGVCLATQVPEVGEPVYVIGSTSSNFNAGGTEPKSIHVGKVALRDYSDPSGWSLELLTQLTVSGVYNNHVGSGVFNRKNQLVGLIVSAPTGAYARFDQSNLPVNGVANTGDYANRINPQASLSNTSFGSGDGRVAMISIQAIQQFVNACRLDYCGVPTSAPPEISSIVVTDAALGTFRQLSYGYFGIGYRSFNGVDYYDAQDFSGAVTGFPGSLYPRLLANGNPITPPNARPIDGIFTSSISGNISSRPAEYQPGSLDSSTAPFGPGLTNSPFAGLLSPGDKILALVRAGQYYFVGSNPGELSPNTYASLFNVGDEVQIFYSPVATNPPYSTTAITAPVILPSRPNYAAYPYEAYSRVQPFFFGLTLLSVLPNGIPGFQPSF